MFMPVEVILSLCAAAAAALDVELISYLFKTFLFIPVAPLYTPLTQQHGIEAHNALSFVHIPWTLSLKRP